MWTCKSYAYRLERRKCCVYGSSSYFVEEEKLLGKNGNNTKSVLIKICQSSKLTMKIINCWIIVCEID